MQRFVNDLVLTGLTENEAKAYLLLLKKPLTATRIAQTIGVNRSNVYGIISTLVQKGCVREIDGNVKTIIAINPEVAFNSMKTTLNMRMRLMDKLARDLEPYYEAEHNNNHKEMIKILHSRSSIIETLERLEKDAQSEVLAFSKPPYIMDVDNLKTLNLPQKASAKKGVIYRAIHEIEPDNLENFVKRLEYFQSMGEEIYVTDSLPMKLFIFDEEIAVFTMENQESSFSDFTFTSFENTDLAKTFHQLFDLYLTKSISLEEYKIIIKSQEKK
ncbi:MAG: helix-turn-helix domain-containing protein [Candidatus Stygibacter australis]|nr:helix-turn-helix domain-containing protein [Candidatus Stygibacter australis]MDP8321574.1 helix-turn-helix domain-containing protein [Candidatus Stygibacter australis]